MRVFGFFCLGFSCLDGGSDPKLSTMTVPDEEGGGERVEVAGAGSCAAEGGGRNGLT